MIVRAGLTYGLYLCFRPLQRDEHTCFFETMVCDFDGGCVCVCARAHALAVILVHVSGARNTMKQGPWRELVPAIPM